MQGIGAYNGKPFQELMKLYPIPPCTRCQIAKKGRGKGTKHNHNDIWSLFCCLHLYLLLVLSTVFAGCAFVALYRCLTAASTRS